MTFLRRNAVVLLPLVCTTVLAIQDLSWQDALPVVSGIILRQFFTSPTSEVAERENAAFVAGADMRPFP